MNADTDFLTCDTLQPYLTTQAEMFEICNSQGHFPNGKEVQWKMEFKYVVRLLPGSYKEDTNWQI